MLRGVVVPLRSPLLERIPGVHHGFSTRDGGVSSGPYGSLNLGGVGDDAENIAENRRRFAASIGLEGQDVVQVEQVHGTRVLDAAEADGEEADGLVTATPSVAIGVRTADCAPILVAAIDARRRPLAVAAIHAGWRGATAGILCRGIEALEARGAERARMVFAIGPTIGLRHFEVGSEVLEAASASIDGGDLPTAKSPKGTTHLDLVELLVLQLERAGIDRSQIDRAGGCTFDDEARFYSHRRDRGVTGRHLSAIHFEATR